MSKTMRRLLFNDGEGADFNDVNNAQKYLQALSTDIGLAAAARATDTLLDVGYQADVQGLPIKPIYSYARYSGGAPRGNGVTRQVSNIAGMLGQYIGGDFDGSASKFLWYSVANDEMLKTIDVGDGNPRIDLICYKIDEVDDDSTTRDFKDATTGIITSQTFSKSRHTRLTVTVVKGMPAGSPTYPAIPSGYVPWCGVYVPAAFNAAFINTIHLRDFRIPLGWKKHRIYAYNVADGEVSGWQKTGGASGIRSIAQGVGSRIVFPLQINMHNERLVSLTISGQLNAGCSVFLNRRQYGFSASDTSGALEQLADFTSDFPGSPTFNVLQKYFISNDLTSSGVEPIWGSGRKVPLLDGDVIAVPLEASSGIEIEIFAGRAAPSSHPDTLYYVEFETSGGW